MTGITPATERSDVTLLRCQVRIFQGLTPALLAAVGGSRMLGMQDRPAEAGPTRLGEITVERINIAGTKQSAGTRSATTCPRPRSSGASGSGPCRPGRRA